MSDPALGLLMLGLIVVVIMLGFPTAFTLMGLGMFFGFMFMLKRSATFRLGFDRLILKVPIIGGILQKATIARWTRTLQTMFAAGVPLVFGTYDVDANGEYNAAAFVEPKTGKLGFYRKTDLFLFTEHVPAWLDGPTFRRLLPWAGTWKRGDGAQGRRRAGEASDRLGQRRRRRR